jgi:DNA-binding transcriptional ArsR family regulator
MAQTSQAAGLAGLEANAGRAAQLLKLLANEHRLLILCQLAAEEEMTVNALAAAVGLSQSALSQHLARLREDGLVVFRREAQTLHYRVDDANTLEILQILKRIFCP